MCIMSVTNGVVSERILLETLIQDYIVYKLAENGVNWPELLGLNVVLDNDWSLVRRLNRVATRWHDSDAEGDNLDVVDILRNLHISKDSVLTTFTYISDSLFQDDTVSWCKLVTLIDFSAELAVMCVDREIPNMVVNILTRTSRFIENNTILRDWIDNNGGWEVFLHHVGTSDRKKRKSLSDPTKVQLP